MMSVSAASYADSIVVEKGSPLEIELKLAGQDSTCRLVISLEGEKPAEQAAAVPQGSLDETAWMWILGILFFDVVLFAILSVRNKKIKARDEAAKAEKDADRTPVRNVRRPSSITLFGDLKVIDSSGEDVTRRLSPMLQELVMLLICYKPQGGISSASLKEFLWSDKDAVSARNNRAVYMNKLKKILEAVGECSIAHSGDFWSLETEEIYIDYYKLCEILSLKEASAADVSSAVGIISEGTFLSHVEDNEWSDEIKASLADSAISFFERFLASFNIKDNPDLAIRVSDALLSFDSMSETALVTKCRAWKETGNHSLAKQQYQNFVREYSRMYGEEYGKSFSDIIASS